MPVSVNEIRRRRARLSRVRGECYQNPTDTGHWHSFTTPVNKRPAFSSKILLHTVYEKALPCSGCRSRRRILRSGRIPGAGFGGCDWSLVLWPPLSTRLLLRCWVLCSGILLGTQRISLLSPTLLAAPILEAQPLVLELRCRACRDINVVGRGSV